MATMKHHTLPTARPRPQVPPRRRPNSSITSDITESMTIKDLVKKSSHLIPFRVTVVVGNANYVPTVKKGDSLIVHAIKESQVATIVDNKDVTYRVPIHSEAKFGIIGNLDSEEYMCTYSMSELMEADKLPPVVACLGNYKGREESMSFKQFEILVLKEVASVFKSYKRVRVIKAFSITNSVSKCIPKECDVFFSSEASGIQMYLPEILDHASHLLPCRARLFVPKEYRPLLGDLATDSVIIESKSTETSLLACRVNGSKKLIEISTSVHIEVALTTESAVTTTKDLDQSKYTTLTKRKDNLSGCLLKMIRKGYETQGTIVKAAKCSEEDKSEDGSEPNEDYEIVPPAHISSSDSEDVYDDVVWIDHEEQTGAPDKNEATTLPPQNKRNILRKATSLSGLSRPPPTLPKSSAAKNIRLPNSWTSDKKAHSSASLLHLLSEEDSKQTSPPKPKRRESRLNGSSNDIRRVSFESPEVSRSSNDIRRVSFESPEVSRSSNDSKRVSFESPEIIQESRDSGKSVAPPAAATLESVKTALDTLVKTVGRLEEKHTQFERRLAKMESASVAQNPTAKERNISSMTQVEIQNLLKKLGMSKYQDSFAREWIDGEIFQELNDEALKELGVTSELHRIKLLGIISKGYV